MNKYAKDMWERRNDALEERLDAERGTRFYMNQHEKIFNTTLQFYQNELRKNGFDFYFFRPQDMSEVRRYSTTKKPCDFWFFDETFVALELKYTKTDRIGQAQIKEHQIEALRYFAKYKSSNSKIGF